MIAALYVATGGAYFGRPDVDPWDEPRDARSYAGPHPVVAHPPCSRWCQLAFVNQKRYGHRVGDDGGTFAHALNSVRRFGGVLEHPAYSYAWPAFALTRPEPGRWTRVLLEPGLDALGDGLSAYVCQVAQGNATYQHAARKRTWLYYVGRAAPPELDWSEREPSAQVSFCKNHGNSELRRLGKREAKASPPAFRDLLIELARGCQ